MTDSRQQEGAGKRRHTARKKIPAYTQCACGEFDRRALRNEPVNGEWKCRVCAAPPDAPRKLCLVCLQRRPFEMDHPLGWRVSKWTMPLCLNCHAKKTAATVEATNVLARELVNASPEVRLRIRAICRLAEVEYALKVFRNIGERIEYASSHNK